MTHPLEAFARRRTRLRARSSQITYHARLPDGRVWEVTRRNGRWRIRQESGKWWNSLDEVKDYLWREHRCKHVLRA